MLSKKRIKLLIQLEELIGNQCYNSNIQNYGPGGKWEGDGREFRYPITFINKNREKVKVHTIEYFFKNGKITDEMIENGYYAFGANELHIINGLNKMLDYLEKEYGLKIEKDEE